jgi:proteasome lid subunit RPN8/RPN11
MLTEEIKGQIIEHANSSNNEVCGFLIYTDQGIQVQKKENLINSATEFMMKIDEQVKYAAYYHSHIDFDSISDADIIVSERLGLTCIVYNKQSGSFHVYSPNSYKIQYTDRPFLLGFADCFWLVKDYFCHDLNIHLIPETQLLKENLSKEQYESAMTQRFSNEAEAVKDK